MPRLSRNIQIIHKFGYLSMSGIDANDVAVDIIVVRDLGSPSKYDNRLFR